MNPSSSSKMRSISSRRIKEFCDIFGASFLFATRSNEDLRSFFLILCDLVASSNSFKIFFPVRLEDAFTSSTLREQDILFNLSYLNILLLHILNYIFNIYIFIIFNLNYLNICKGIGEIGQ